MTKLVLSSVAVKSSLDDELSNCSTECGESLSAPNTLISADSRKKKTTRVWWVRTNHIKVIIFFISATNFWTKLNKKGDAEAAVSFGLFSLKFGVKIELPLCQMRFGHAVIRVNMWRDTPGDTSRGRSCQNSTASGSAWAELLWCPGGEGSCAHFFCALVERGMLGGLQAVMIFCSCIKGKAPEKEEKREMFLILIIFNIKSCDGVTGNKQQRRICPWCCSKQLKETHYQPLFSFILLQL